MAPQGAVCILGDAIASVFCADCLVVGRVGCAVHRLHRDGAIGARHLAVVSECRAELGELSFARALVASDALVDSCL